MTDPLAFTGATPRFALPQLFPGQAQKEFFVNQAHALTDILLHPAIEGEAASPPVAPAEGECWLVAGPASGAWSGWDGQLAGFSAGTWIAIPPREGLRLFDRASGQFIHYHGGWQRSAAPALPAGGSGADLELRAAFGQLLAALRQAGIFAVT